MRNRYFHLVFFMAVFLWFGSFSKAILPTHFLREGLTFLQIAIGTLLLFVGQLILLLTIKHINARTSWFWALVTSFLFIVLSVHITTVWQYYLASLFAGCSLFFYWVPYNIAHFRMTPKEKTGISSAVMFSVFPVIGVFAPLLAGYLAEINILIVWALSLVFFLLSLVALMKQVNFSVHYDVSSALSAIPMTRVFLLLEGIWEALIFVIVPIYTLFFIKTPLHYGSFVAYLSFVGVLANLIMGKVEDKLQKRRVFLFPITLALALTTLFFPLATDNIISWLVLNGIIQFFVPLFWNITTAMVVDAHADLGRAIPGREIMLAVGRIIGIFLSVLSFALESKPFIIFFVLAGVMMGYFALLIRTLNHKHLAYR